MISQLFFLFVKGLVDGLLDCDFNNELILKISKFFVAKEFEDFIKRNQSRKSLPEEESDESFVDIYLNSGGGDLNVAILLYELIENTVKIYYKNKIKIVMHLVGRAHSAAILFAGVGDIRVIYPNTTIMFHGVASEENGRKTEDFYKRMSEKCKFKNDVMQQYYFTSGYYDFLITDLFADVDSNRWLTHKEIVEGNIATHYPPSYSKKMSNNGKFCNVSVNSFTLWRTVENPNEPPDHISKSGYEYWYLENSVIRKSSHWGVVKENIWLIKEAEPNYNHENIIVAEAKYSDFMLVDKVFKTKVITLDAVKFELGYKISGYVIIKNIQRFGLMDLTVIETYIGHKRWSSVSDKGVKKKEILILLDPP